MHRIKTRIHRLRAAGFSLVEWLFAMAIIILLGALSMPALERAAQRADLARCAGNLRAIGAAVLNFANDNESRFPVIETNPTNPVYSSEDGAEPILEVLGEYGVTESILRCPADLRRANFFEKTGSSYEWRPVVDGELVTSPVIYGRRGERYPASSRIRLMMDFERVHGGQANMLFADGHVRTR